MTIFFEKKALKEFNKLQENNKTLILSKLKELKKFPSLENLDIKKLKTPFEWYRLRVWNHRALFVVNKDKITIYSVAHRKDAYK